MEEIETSQPPPSNEEPASTMTVEVAEWERLTREVEEWKNKYLHALAESENSRKRLQKERQEMIQHAMNKVIVEFLNPMDQLENALKYADQAAPEVQNWAVGFKMIATQFRDVLTSHGVVSFVSEGQRFDPNFHEAVKVVESDDHLPDMVIKEHTCGYMAGGKVIRAARVDVSKTPTPEQKDDNKNNEGEVSP